MTTRTSPAAGRARSYEPIRDLPALIHLVEAAFDQDPGLHRVSELDFALMRLAAPMMSITKRIPFFRDRMDGVVWEEEGRLVGNVSFALIDGVPRAWMVGNVAVAADMRGRGISRILTTLTLDTIASRGGGLVVLDVREDNAVARNLYESLGFEHVETLWEYTLTGDPPAVTADPSIRSAVWQDRTTLETIERQAHGAGAVSRPNIEARAIAIASPKWMRLTGAAFAARYTSAFIADTGQGSIELQSDALFGKHRLRLVITPGSSELTGPLIRTGLSQLSGKTVTIALEAIGDVGEIPAEIGFVSSRTLLRLQKDLPKT